MAGRKHSFDRANDSDASYTPEEESDECFDKNEADDSSSETEATDIEDPSCDDEDRGLDVDIDDQIQLFGGNVHPPEYYRWAVEGFNDSAYEAQDYSDGSKLLLDACEEQWRR